MESTAYPGVLSVAPFMLISVAATITVYLLAREKGRRVVLWTVLGAIPFVNIFCLWYFIGAANLRLEAKLDHILSALAKVT